MGLLVPEYYPVSIYISANSLVWVNWENVILVQVYMCLFTVMHL